MSIYFTALAVLVLGMITAAFIKEDWKIKACCVSAGLAAVLLLIPAVLVLLTGGTLAAELNLSLLFGSINFVIDPLSAFFILVISIMSFTASIYGIGYIKPYLNKGMGISSHCVFFLLLIISMLLVCTVQNALFFLFAWEIMSLSSFFLVIFENEKKEVLKSGIKYMIYMHLSVIFIIAAFALLSLKTDSYSFKEFALFLKDNPKIADIAFLLAFAGFGIKAGFMPFHNWLPEAHPAAPSHISGLMSGVMIKTGIYGILRMIYITGGSKLTACIVLGVSVISALWGVLYAIGQHDIKKLLACHSIENIGIIGIGTGIGMLGLMYNHPVMAALGFAGAVLHILNHSIFKELLFFAAGSIYKKTHTRDIELLGGLIKKMPFTSVFFITGSIAISGLPPFNGFISEFLIYAAIIAGLAVKNPALFSSLICSLAALALAGTMAILCFTKVSGVMLSGSPRSEAASKADKDNELVMLIPMGFLAVLCLVIGVFPESAVMFVFTPVSMFASMPQAVSSIAQITSVLSFIFFIFLLILLAVSLLRIFINRRCRKHRTWGCGYGGITPRMQYTAAGYADLFISAMSPFFKHTAHIKKPKEIFPKDAYFEDEIEDIEEAYVIKPLLKLDEQFLSKFERLQNGNMRQYILFGLIFLLIAVIGLGVCG